MINPAIKKVTMVCKKKGMYDSIDLGDCFIIRSAHKAIVIDCGSIEIADKAWDNIYIHRVILDSLDIIITHPDSDHYAGVGRLVEKAHWYTKVNIYYMRYTDIKDLLAEVKKIDGRRTYNSLTRCIDNIYKDMEDKFSNLEKLSNVTICPVIPGASCYEFFDCGQTIVEICQPNKYEVKEILKQYTDDNNVKFDNESAKNTLSLRIVIYCGIRTIFICGDYPICDSSGYIKPHIKKLISEHARDTELTQFVVPHHGKAEYVKALVREYPEMKLCVSDNKTYGQRGGLDKSLLSYRELSRIECISKEHNDWYYTIYSYN